MDPSVVGLVYIAAHVPDAGENEADDGKGSGSGQNHQPDLERWYATRANSHKVEIFGASHTVYISLPKDVAALMEEAAFHAR
jgi:hypothetical protein